MLGITIDQLETTAVINVNQKCMIVYALYKNGEKSPQIRLLISQSFCKSTQTHENYNIPISLNEIEKRTTYLVHQDMLVCLAVKWSKA